MRTFVKLFLFLILSGKSAVSFCLPPNAEAPNKIESLAICTVYYEHLDLYFKSMSDEAKSEPDFMEGVSNKTLYRAVLKGMKKSKDRAEKLLVKKTSKSDALIHIEDAKVLVYGAMATQNTVDNDREANRRLRETMVEIWYGDFCEKTLAGY
jgi:hypothetical protein